MCGFDRWARALSRASPPGRWCSSSSSTSSWRASPTAPPSPQVTRSTLPPRSPQAAATSTQPWGHLHAPLTACPLTFSLPHRPICTLAPVRCGAGPVVRARPALHGWGLGHVCRLGDVCPGGRGRDARRHGTHDHLPHRHPARGHRYGLQKQTQLLGQVGSATDWPIETWGTNVT